MNRTGFTSDAEGCGKVVREILERRRPKVWRHLAYGSVAEADYVERIARWAFHWAAKSLRFGA